MKFVIAMMKHETNTFPTSEPFLMLSTAMEVRTADKLLLMRAGHELCDSSVYRFSRKGRARNRHAHSRIC